MYKFFVLAMEYALFISYIYELYSHTRARTHAHTHTNGVLECCSCWNKESDVRLKTMKICIIHSNTIDIYWMHSYAYNYITRRNHVKYTILCKAMFIYFFFFSCSMPSSMRKTLKRFTSLFLFYIIMYTYFFARTLKQYY